MGYLRGSVAALEGATIRYQDAQGYLFCVHFEDGMAHRRHLDGTPLDSAPVKFQYVRPDLVHVFWFNGGFGPLVSFLVDINAMTFQSATFPGPEVFKPKLRFGCGDIVAA